jgi:hypothetical protein
MLLAASSSNALRLTQWSAQGGKISGVGKARPVDVLFHQTLCNLLCVFRSPESTVNKCGDLADHILVIRRQRLPSTFPLKFGVRRHSEGP